MLTPTGAHLYRLVLRAVKQSVVKNRYCTYCSPVLHLRTYCQRDALQLHSNPVAFPVPRSVARALAGVRARSGSSRVRGLLPESVL